MSSHADLDGQRSSIAFINSSAQRTASEIAATVAGTLFPPSNGDNFRAARIAAAIKMTRLRPSSTEAILAVSPFVRHRFQIDYFFASQPCDIERRNSSPWLPTGNKHSAIGVSR